jgi:hypothetical protein
MSASATQRQFQDATIAAAPRAVGGTFEDIVEAPGTPGPVKKLRQLPIHII